MIRFAYTKPPAPTNTPKGGSSADKDYEKRYINYLKDRLNTTETANKVIREEFEKLKAENRGMKQVLTVIMRYATLFEQQKIYPVIDTKEAWEDIKREWEKCL